MEYLWLSFGVYVALCGVEEHQMLLDIGCGIIEVDVFGVRTDISGCGE